MKNKVSVVIPTLRRPEQVKVAVDSVLGQECSFPVEVIVSNNGSDPQTRELLLSAAYHDRVTYVEPDELLPMTAHWEWLVKKSTGDYLFVLPDRRLLKQGALERLASTLDLHQDCDAVVCSDEWIFQSGRVVSNQTFYSDQTVATRRVVADIERGVFDRNRLPLGLNCLLRMSFLSSFQKQHGAYFDAISPDFRSAFNYLFCSENVYVVGAPLMLVTGFHSSNGGKAYRGDRSYSNSLGKSGKYQYVPEVLEGNVWASIFEDYLRSKKRFTGDAAFSDIASAFSMRQILLEETTKVISARLSRASLRRFIAARRIMCAEGWLVRHDFGLIKAVFASLRQFTPVWGRVIYRYIYARCKYPERDLMKIAGF